MTTITRDDVDRFLESQKPHRLQDDEFTIQMAAEIWGIDAKTTQNRLDDFVASGAIEAVDHPVLLDNGKRATRVYRLLKFADDITDGDV